MPEASRCLQPGRIVPDPEIDREWADRLAPIRHVFLLGAGAATVGAGLVAARAQDEQIVPNVTPRVKLEV